MTLNDNKFYAPDAGFIAELADAALRSLPEAFRAEATKVALRVEDFVSDEQFEELDLDDPYALTGLYEGTPLTEKSVMDQATSPDVIWLFRRPILDEWAQRGDVCLADLVTHVVVHELAHHFGWSDAEIAAIDRWWD